MDIILFDADGVINNDLTPLHNGYVGLDPVLLERFSRMVHCMNPKPQLVVISTWGQDWYKDNKSRQDEVANYLDEEFAKYDLEIYDRINDCYAINRGKEIDIYLAEHEVDRYVIIDDELLCPPNRGTYNKELHKHWVRPNEHFGLTDWDVLEVMLHWENDYWGRH